MASFGNERMIRSMLVGVMPVGQESGVMDFIRAVSEGFEHNEMTPATFVDHYIRIYNNVDLTYDERQYVLNRIQPIFKRLLSQQGEVRNEYVQAMEYYNNAYRELLKQDGKYDVGDVEANVVKEVDETEVTDEASVEETTSETVEAQTETQEKEADGDESVVEEQTDETVLDEESSDEETPETVGLLVFEDDDQSAVYKDVTRSDLEAMTVKTLEKVAQVNSIDTTGVRLKDDLIDTLMNGSPLSEG